MMRYLTIALTKGRLAKKTLKLLSQVGASVLLVGVLIIGILAAIALPQYKMVVGKSQYSTLKDISKTLAQARDRYYLVHDVYPNKFTNVTNGIAHRRWLCFHGSEHEAKGAPCRLHGTGHFPADSSAPAQ